MAESRHAQDGGPESGHESGGTSRLEWAVAAACALLVLGSIGYLLYDALSGSSTPPEVWVTVEAVRPSGPGYLVEFEAENLGHKTADGLGIEGTLKRGATTVETRSTTLDHLPGDSKRRGGLYFTEDPRAYTLDLVATGYGRP